MISGDDRHMQMEKDEVAAPQKWIRFHDEVDTLTRRLNKLVPNANTGLQHSSVMPAHCATGRRLQWFASSVAVDVCCPTSRNSFFFLKFVVVVSWLP